MKVHFLLNGSTLLKNGWFADEVTAKILAARPGSEVTRLSRPGTWGAIAMARQAGTQAEPKTINAIESKPTSWRPVASAPTEGRNPKSTGFAEMPLADAIKLMLSEDATLPGKVLAESAHLEWTVEAVAKAFASGGRLI